MRAGNRRSEVIVHNQDSRKLYPNKCGQETDVVSNLEPVSNMLFQFCGRCFGGCSFQEDLDHSFSRPIAFKPFLKDREFLL
jgi:hypothetical protein